MYERENWNLSIMAQKLFIYLDHAEEGISALSWFHSSVPIILILKSDDAYNMLKLFYTIAKHKT